MKVSQLFPEFTAHLQTLIDEHILINPEKINFTYIWALSRKARDVWVSTDHGEDIDNELLLKILYEQKYDQLKYLRKRVGVFKRNETREVSLSKKLTDKNNECIFYENQLRYLMSCLEDARLKAEINEELVKEYNLVNKNINSFENEKYRGVK